MVLIVPPGAPAGSEMYTPVHKMAESDVFFKFTGIVDVSNLLSYDVLVRAVIPGFLVCILLQIERDAGPAISPAFKKLPKGG